MKLHYVYTVHAGDTPWGIARRLTGDGSRWPELVRENPRKATSPVDPQNPDSGRSFASMEPREELLIPLAWKGAGRIGVPVVGSAATMPIVGEPEPDDDDGVAWSTPSWDEP